VLGSTISEANWLDLLILSNLHSATELKERVMESRLSWIRRRKSITGPFFKILQTKRIEFLPFLFPVGGEEVFQISLEFFLRNKENCGSHF
jgi:hypothetical protein